MHGRGDEQLPTMLIRKQPPPQIREGAQGQGGGPHREGHDPGWRGRVREIRTVLCPHPGPEV